MTLVSQRPLLLHLEGQSASLSAWSIRQPKDSFNGIPPLKRHTVVAAGKKKKKASSSKKSPRAKPALREWKFEQLMLVWDDSFERNCAEASRVEEIWRVASAGDREFGRGCVLVREILRAASRGSASGFGKGAAVPKSLTSSDDEEIEGPETVSLAHSVEYVPRALLEDPFTKEMSVDPNQSSVPLPSKGDLINVMRSSGDGFRILQLTSQATPTANDMQGGTDATVLSEQIRSPGGGMPGGLPDSLGQVSGPPETDLRDEDPYDLENGELVLMLSVELDGQRVVGADVVQRSQRDEKELAAGLPASEGEWQLLVRDLIGL